MYEWKEGELVNTSPKKTYSDIFFTECRADGTTTRSVPYEKVVKEKIYKIREIKGRGPCIFRQGSWIPYIQTHSPCHCQ